jgi:acyl carrier protein
MESSIASNVSRRREPARSADKVVDLMQVCVVNTIRRDLPMTAAIHGQARIAADLGFDSLALMELVFALEDRFAVSIPLEAVARISTVDDLVDALRFYLEHRQAA